MEGISKKSPFFKLPPGKYPEMFHQQKSFFSSMLKKEVNLLHRDKIKCTLEDLHKTLTPILKKFDLSYSILTEAPLDHAKTAGTQKIKINISPPGVQEKSFIYTHHIQIKIRNPEKPQDIHSFLNKTTSLAILLHEFAHLQFPGHGLDFMSFLRDLYQYAEKMKIFPYPSEIHMIPSTREPEILIFEKKGMVSDSELSAFFEKNP